MVRTQRIFTHSEINRFLSLSCLIARALTRGVGVCVWGCVWGVCVRVRVRVRVHVCVCVRARVCVCVDFTNEGRQLFIQPETCWDELKRTRLQNLCVSVHVQARCYSNHYVNGLSSERWRVSNHHYRGPAASAIDWLLSTGGWASIGWACCQQNGGRILIGCSPGWNFINARSRKPQIFPVVLSED